MTDTIIIGGGLGGLVCGALLAQKGYKVCLLEQHDIVGGAATCFKRKGGFRCEVGLHEMDDAFGKSKKALFDTLGLYKHLDFIRLPEFYRVKFDDEEFTLPDDVPAAKKTLKERFPSETGKIDRYFDTILSIGNELDGLIEMKWYKLLLFPLFFPTILRNAARSAADLTADMDPKLALILQANVGYYAATAESLGALYHAVAQSGYYSGGGWFVKGGSQTLSDHLAGIIIAHGGEVITSASVTAVRLDRGKACGVTYAKRGEELQRDSRTVVANASPLDVYAHMLPAQYHDPKVDVRTVSDSLLTVYIGFAKNLRTVYGKRPYSSFFLEGCRTLDDYDAKVGGPLAERAFVFVDYSQIDAGLTPEEQSFGAICTTDFLKEWRGLDRETYRAKKTEVAEALLTRLEAEYPGIRDLISFYEVATAATMQRYLRTPGGTAYGFAPTPEQLRSRWPVPSRTVGNLFFAGAWVMGGGFTPAMLSGQMSADAVVKQLKRTK